MKKEYRQDLAKLTGQRLSEAIAESGMTQVDVARLSGIPRNSLCVMISGGRSLPPDRAEILGKLLNVRQGWLMGVDERKAL